MSNDNLDFGILPMKLSDNENIIVQTIICTQISGGQNYENNMPKTVTLKRTDLKTGESFELQYVQISQATIPLF